MKINKLIAKGLSIGFLLNSLSVLSYANTEIPNRYQTLEGEYITIDDSMEGNLEEIEIFGNTVQDENNLEDIQSVGDLYVDKNGNPILDKQGRKQYKIDIISSNKNILPEDLKVYRVNTIGNDIYNGIVIENENTILKKDEDGYYISTDTGWTTVCITEKIEISPGMTYSFFSISKQKNRCYNRAVLFYDKEGNFIKRLWDEESISKKEIKPPTNAKFMRIQISSQNSKSNNHNIKLFMLEGSMPNNYIFDLWENQQNWLINNGFCVEPESNKTTIFLPIQLQKVGDVADRLYWDKVKKRYVIEKNIHFNKINSNSITASYHNGNFVVRVDPKQNNFSKFIITGNDGFINNLGTYGSDVWTYVNCNEDYLLSNNISNDTEVLAKYAKDKDIYSYYYQLKDPILIETNITSKLKIQTYDEKTHIYIESENGINPTLKVTVDRLPQIAKEAIAQAESDNSNHNIALARRYINMLPESSYKDQLQNQLSDIFSSDMVLDMKTATSNLDIYIKSENILQMSLDTNQISFDDFSGIEDVVKENAVNITINSSLPYQLNTYLPTEIQNADKTKTLDKSILNIKENSESAYQTFTNTTDKIVLKDNCSSGNYLTHGVDLKLAGGIAHEKDIYKATIKLEAEQK